MHFREYAWDFEIDHEWHEFDSIEETKQTATEKISIADFLTLIEIKEFDKNNPHLFSTT
jgi:hypothetical protein